MVLPVPLGLVELPALPEFRDLPGRKAIKVTPAGKEMLAPLAPLALPVLMAPMVLPDLPDLPVLLALPVLPDRPVRTGPPKKPPVVAAC